jgi:hypothetical protein
VPSPPASAYEIHVIALPSRAESADVLAAAAEILGKHGIPFSSRSESVPGFVGELEGIWTVVEAVRDPALGAVAGVALQELVNRLRSKGRKPRIGLDVAEALARSDLERRVGDPELVLVRSRVLPGCDTPYRMPRRCFYLEFEGADGVGHTYVLTNEGVIDSYDRD